MSDLNKAIDLFKNAAACRGCGKPGHIRAECRATRGRGLYRGRGGCQRGGYNRQQDGQTSNDQASGGERFYGEPICYMCNQKGHMVRDCPDKAEYYKGNNNKEEKQGNGSVSGGSGRQPAPTHSRNQ